MKMNQLFKFAIVILAFTGAFTIPIARAQTNAVFQQNANGQSLGFDSCGTEHFASNTNLWTRGQAFALDCHNNSYQSDVSNWNTPDYPNASNIDVTIGSHTVHLNGSVAMGNLNIDGGGLLNLDAINSGGAGNNPIDVAFNGGTIVNNGSLRSIGSNSAAQTYHFNVDTLLTGTGTTIFDISTKVNGPGVLTIDTNQNVIVGGGGYTVLSASLVNRGMITSDGSSSYYDNHDIIFASPHITNTGTIRTITNGGIVFQASTVIDNTGGTLSAIGYNGNQNNFVFHLNYGVSITGGTLVSSGGPLSNYFDVGGATFNNLSIATGTKIIVNGSVLTLNGAIANDGLIICPYNQPPGSFNVASDTTLSGTGRINVQYPSNNTIASGATLTLGPGQTLDGGGCAVTGALTNHGLISATGSPYSPDLALKGGDFVNDGIMQASGANLYLGSGNFTIDNTGGIIQALDGVHVYFQGNIVVQNGTLTTAGTGSITNSGTVTLESVTNNGTFGNIGPVALKIAGTVINNGTINVSYDYYNPGNSQMILTGDAALDGNGLVTLSTYGSSTASIEAPTGGTLTNGPSHVIVIGAGASINPSLVNNGTTQARESEGGAEHLNGPTVTNNGMLQVWGNGNAYNYPALLQQSGSSTLTNYDAVSQTLTGGTYSMLAAPNAAVLSLNIGPIVINNATVILSGPGAQFGPINSIHQNWGTLAVLGGQTFSTTAASSSASTVSRSSKSSKLLRVSKSLQVNPLAASDSLANAGTVKLDENSALNVNGNYSQGSNGILYIEIGSNGPNANFHQLNVSGTAALAGTLNVRLVNGFTPAADQTFPILNASGVTGGFVQVHGADVTYTATGVSIHPNGAPIPLALTGAVCPKTHQSGGAVAGTYPLPLSLSSPPTVESRSGGPGGNHTLVFAFTNALVGVDSVSASATSPTGPQPVTVSTRLIGPDPHEYIVNLSGVPNAQYVTVTLNGVHDDFGQVNAAVSATMGVLAGDTNGDGRVNVGDTLQTRSRSGQTLDQSTGTFRSDVNLDGRINVGDTNFVKAHSGDSLP